MIGLHCLGGPGFSSRSVSYFVAFVRDKHQVTEYLNIDLDEIWFCHLILDLYFVENRKKTISQKLLHVQYYYYYYY